MQVVFIWENNIRCFYLRRHVRSVLVVSSRGPFSQYVQEENCIHLESIVSCSSKMFSCNYVINDFCGTAVRGRCGELSASHCLVSFSVFTHGVESLNLSSSNSCHALSQNKSKIRALNHSSASSWLQLAMVYDLLPHCFEFASWYQTSEPEKNSWDMSYDEKTRWMHHLIVNIRFYTSLMQVAQLHRLELHTTLNTLSISNNVSVHFESTDTFRTRVKSDKSSNTTAGMPVTVWKWKIHQLSIQSME